MKIFLILAPFWFFACASDEIALSTISVADSSNGDAVKALEAEVGQQQVAPDAGCASTCDDDNACTADYCVAGECVHQWAQGCMPCEIGDDCQAIVQTCHDGDPLWHYDGWMGACLPDRTCPQFHKLVACDDGDPCTLELGCGYDDGDDVCLSKPITPCTAP